jgi:hypothetical protein
MIFLTQLFPAVGVLHGQTPSEQASDPFAGLQKSLEVAADEQLALGGSPISANRVSRAREERRVRVGEVAFAEERNVVSAGGSSAEERFRSLGVDAGAIFREFGVPVALLKVAQVESNWKPFALSRKGAFGLWQLMPATARRYGLRVDVASDDRADTDKATRAAARYLRDLHEQFGDWALALAAYNAGEDAVARAVERGASRDFWSLSQRKLLPAETRAYVPAVLGSLNPHETQRAIGLEATSRSKFVLRRIEYAAARQVQPVDTDSKGRL